MSGEQPDQTERPTLDGPNPLLDAWRGAIGRPDEPSVRDEAIARFAFAVPDEGALSTVERVSPGGVVEIGAGTGYWARLLADRGVDVVAFDVAPASSPENPWFADSASWFEVRAGDHHQLAEHAARTLLMVWPTKNEDWPGDALERFAEAGGATVAYVGEGPTSHTGDDRFHALTGSLDRCWSCAYGVTTAACVCGVVPRFGSVETVTLPHWTGYEDDLHVLARLDDAEPLGPSPRRSGRRGTGRTGAADRADHGAQRPWWRRRR